MFHLRKFHVKKKEGSRVFQRSEMEEGSKDWNFPEEETSVGTGSQGLLAFLSRCLPTPQP